MKIPTLLGFLILIAGFQNVFGQKVPTEVKIIQQKTIEYVDNREQVKSHIIETENGKYLITANNQAALGKASEIGEYIVHPLGEGLRLKKTIPLEMKNRKLEFVKVLNGKIYFFSSMQLKKEKYFFYQTLNEKNMKLSPTQSIFQKENKGQSINVNRLAHELSPDGSKLLLYFIQQKGVKKFISFVTLDVKSDLAILNENEFELDSPSKKKSRLLRNALVDDNGQSYFLTKSRGQYYFQSFSKERKEPYKISFDNNAFTKKETAIIDLKIALGKNKTIKLFGLYAQEQLQRMKYSTYGIFQMEYSKDLTPVSQKPMFYQLDKDLTQQFNENKLSKDFFKKYQIKNIIQKENGNIILVSALTNHLDHIIDGKSPKDRFGNRSYADFPLSIGSQYFNEGNILISEISPDQKINWTTKLFKENDLVNGWEQNHSYFLHQKGDELFFIFFSYPESVDVDRDTRLEKKRKYRLKKHMVVVRVHEQGASDRQVLISNEDKKVFALHSEHSNSYSPDGFYLLKQNGNVEFPRSMDVYEVEVSLKSQGR